MATGLLFNTAGKLLQVLGSLAIEEIGLACGVKEEFDKLKETISTIRAVLSDAEEEQNQKNQEVIVWLQKLKDAFYEADDLLDDFSTELKQREVMSGCTIAKEVRIFFSKSNHIAYSYMMARKIKNIREKLKEIKNDRKFHLTEHRQEKRVGRTERETYSFVYEEKVIGRDHDRNEIKQYLLRDEDDVENVSVLSIVGIGGIGKTTLAQSVYNDDDVKKRFELKMWVCVSNDFSMKVIAEQIIKSATCKEPENLGIDKLQEKLRQEINGKKYLLVLDDVWNENPNRWNELKDLLKNGAKGSMILVTTRSEQVAKITSKDRRYHLQGLPKDKSWSLFKQIAFEQGEEPKSSTLIAIGKEILAKCAGVPLAIKTIGRLLYDNYAMDDWLHFRDSELSKIDQEETDVLPILKLSYDYLPSYLKQCFAYCALFPKDYSFEKEKVIYLWMAQGFVQTTNENQSPEDLGNKYFMDLLSRSFFQVAPQDGAIFMYNTHRRKTIYNTHRRKTMYNTHRRKTMYKMHDLMHDLAQLVIGSEGIIATSCTKYINERCRHVSLGFHLEPSQKFPEELLKAKHIRTLLFPFKPLESPDYIRPNLSCRNIFFIYCLCWYDSENFRDEITLTYAGSKFWCLRMLDFSCLRMLDLSCLYLQKLPSSIGRLKYLRYLDLSCNEIIKLPNSILKLINLEILDLSYCYRLKKLPKDMRKMVSLRYLIIEECTSLYKGNGGLPTELEPLTKPRKTSPL